MSERDMIRLICKIIDIIAACEVKKKENDCFKHEKFCEAAAYECIKDEFLKIKEKESVNNG